MRRLAVPWVLGVVVLAACTSNPSPPPPGPSERPSAAAPPVTISFAGAARTPELVAGKDFEVVRQIPTAVDGDALRYVGMLSDTTALAKRTPPADEGEPGDPGAPKSESMVSVDLASGRATTLASNGTEDKPSYIVSASLGEDYAVWVETHHANLAEMDWDLYTMSLSTKKAKKIASYTDLGIEHPPWPSPSAIWPQIIKGQVFFVAVAVAGVDGSTAKNAVFRVPADGSKPITKAFDDAIDVFADGDALVFDRGGKVGRWDTGAGKQIPSGATTVDEPCGIFFNEGVLVQCSRDGRIIISERSGRRTILEGLPGQMGYLNATSRWVGFSTQDQSYLFDLRRQRLGRLKSSVTFPVDRFEGNTLKYAEQGPSARTPATSPVIELLPR